MYLLRSIMLNLLLVEDDPMDVVTFKRGLAKAGIASQLTEASNGQEALDLLRSGAVSPHQLLVFLDVEMPMMDGLRMLRELRLDPVLRSIPVLIFTAFDTDEYRKVAQDLNCAGFFRKPLEFTDLTDLLQTVASYWKRGFFS